MDFFLGVQLHFTIDHIKKLRVVVLNNFELLSQGGRGLFFRIIVILIFRRSFRSQSIPTIPATGAAAPMRCESRSPAAVLCLNHREDHQRDQQEVDNALDEVAIHHFPLKINCSSADFSKVLAVLSPTHDVYFKERKLLRYLFKEKLPSLRFRAYYSSCMETSYQRHSRSLTKTCINYQ